MVDAPRPLHPNIARIAARYDEILGRFARKQISATKAHREIAALVARDDEGTLWSIDPKTGGFLRETRTGTLIPDTPPTYGLATPTPHDVSTGKAFNPDNNIEFHAVEDELLYSPSQFSGSTRMPRTPIPVPASSWFRRAWDYVRDTFSR